MTRSTYNGRTTNHRESISNHNPNNTDPSRISSQAKHRYWNSNSLSMPCCTEGEFLTSSCVKSRFCVLFIECESNKNDGVRTIRVFAIIGHISSLPSLNPLLLPSCRIHSHPSVPIRIIQFYPHYRCFPQSVEIAPIFGKLVGS